MDRLLQTLMDGLAVGSLYALIALGYTMVYGILKFINFAHSDVFALGAWISYTFATLLAGLAGWAVTGAGAAVPPMWAGPAVLLAAMTFCGIVGFTIERLAYKPLRRAPRLNVLITAIGVSLLLQNVGQLQFTLTDHLKLPFGTRPAAMPALLEERALNDTVTAEGRLAPGADPSSIAFDRAVTLEPERSYRIEVTSAAGSRTLSRVISPEGEFPAGAPLAISPPLAAPATGAESFKLRREPRVPIRLVDAIGAGTAVALMLVLEWLVFRTKLGRAMRAVSFDTRVASLMGIPVDRVISFTFVLGSSLAAAAGFLYAMKYPVLNQTAAATWVLLGLKAFVAAVVGGIGNVRGAMLGGFFIGLIEIFGAQYISSELRNIYVFALLIIVLLVRPAGILGKAVAEKV